MTGLRGPNRSQESKGLSRGGTSEAIHDPNRHGVDLGVSLACYDEQEYEKQRGKEAERLRAKRIVPLKH